MKYKCKNDFNIRIPYNSINLYDKLEESDFLENNLKNFVLEHFDENLKTLSAELYNDFFLKTKHKINIAVLKYLIRSTTRCTPYGLTAGVALGKFALNDSLIINKDFLKKARPDMEWLVNVIKQCEEELSLDLFVLNSNSYKKDGFLLVKKWNSCFIDNIESQNKRIEINLTNAVSDIIENCKSPISIKNLIFKLKETYPNKDETFLKNFIKVLLNKEFLVSNLRIGNKETNQFKRLINTLDKYENKVSFYGQLLKIDELINKYNNSQIGMGIGLYKDIISKMENIYSTKNYLQIDMYSTDSLCINDHLKNSLEEYAEFLSSVSYYMNENNEFILKFEEKFGNQLVKLDDLIEDKELNLKTDNMQNNNQFYNNFQSLMISIFLENDNKDDIDLDLYKDKVKYYFKDMIEEHHKVDLSFYLIKENNEYKFITSPLVGANDNGKIMGRFNYLLGGSETRYNNKVVDFSFIPADARHYNVITSIDKNSLYVNYGAFNDSIENEVLYNDIYVGVRNGKLCFFDKNTKRNIIFSTSNMFVDQGYPKALQYILSINNSQDFNSFNLYQNLLKVISNSPVIHFPQIKYKNFILFPRTWKLDKSFINNNHLIDKQVFIKKLENYKIKYNLPRHILIGPSDKKLLLCLDNKNHIEILWDLYSKDLSLLMYDINYSKENLLIADKNGRKHLGEFVFSLESDISIKDIEIDDNQLFLDYEKIVETSQHFFDNWIYLKIYTKNILMLKILVFYIQKLSSILFSKKYISEFFYVRYTDPNEHIRIRIKHKNNKTAEVLQEIEPIVTELIKNNYINDYAFDTYCPEINRYGGDQCIEKAESMFCADSLSVINMLELYTNKLLDFNIEQIFIISAYFILNHFELSDEEKVDILAQFTYAKKGNVEFNKDFKFIEKIIEKPDFLQESENGIRLLINFDARKHAYLDYWTSVLECFENKKTVQREILLSVLHMHFNRMIGVNREVEVKLMGYLRKLIFIVYTRGKYKQ